MSAGPFGGCVGIRERKDRLVMLGRMGMMALLGCVVLLDRKVRGAFRANVAPVVSEASPD
jgi:hypothetical protein